MTRFSRCLQVFLFLVHITSVLLCGRTRSCPRPPPPPPPNVPPVFNDKCYESIEVTAPRGQTSAYVTWPDSKFEASDPDSSTKPTVILVSIQGKDSVFTGKIPTGTPVHYRARDGRGGVAICTFYVKVTVKYCSAVPVLQHGQRTCTGVENNVYGASCASDCGEGYERKGARQVVCNENEQWSAAFPTCQPISCGDPGTIHGGQVDCPYGHTYRETCTITCNNGYRHSGSSFITCSKHGIWSSLLPCLDVEDPKFPSGCPPMQTLDSGRLGSSVPVTWTDPDTSDNSGLPVTLTSVPARGIPLGPGSHIFTITATDRAGNYRNCFFVVVIESKQCQAITTPDSGRVSCSNGYLEGSECTVTCKTGYQLQGQAILTCLSTEQWNVPVPTCDAVECPVPQVNHGRFICPHGRTYQKLCLLDCDSGFMVQSLGYSICNADGSWLTFGSCIDKEPPDFPNGCPDDVDTYAAALGQPTFVTWPAPAVQDNSGLTVQLTSDPQPQSNFSVGVTPVTYIATDPAGNTQSCSFKVIVTTLVCSAPDFEAANASLRVMTYDCPNGFVYGASCTIDCTSGYPQTGPDAITCEKNDQTYPPTMSWGWQGPSSIQPGCALSNCPDLDPPMNGALTCHLGNMGYDCLMACQDPYDVPAALASEHIYCLNSNQYWTPSKAPDCTVMQRPQGVKVQGDLFYYANHCNVSKDELRQNFIDRMNSDPILRDACVSVPSCVVENVEVHCGATRTKRDASEGEHEIVKRQTTGHSHYVFIAFDVLINLTTVGSNSPKQIFQLCKELKDNITAELQSGVRNGTFDQADLVLDPQQAVGVPRFVFQCPSGTLPRQRTDSISCVGCSKGYYVPDGQQCQECPVGTYADVDNATSCTPCPQGWSTASSASTSSSQCTELCPSGSVSPNGFVPCQPCPLGQYQSGVGAVTCQPCPLNTWTDNTGATGSGQCVPAAMKVTNTSVIGDINHNWSSLTVSLQVSFPNNGSSVTVSVRSALDGSVLASYVFSASPDLQEIRDSDDRLFQQAAFIVTSPGVTLSQQNVTVRTLTQQPPSSTRLTVHSEQKKVLIAGLGAFGKVLTTTEMTSLTSSCTVDVDDNLLTWTPVPSDVTVNSQCVVVDQCSSDPCGDHGVCSNRHGGFECQCQDGWTGVNCSVSPDPCLKHQCQNGASCLPAGDNYTCTCLGDYTGIHCQLEKVHGGWAEWLSWTQCTTDCGSKQKRERLCTNPAPLNGGNNCAGEGEQIRGCLESNCTDHDIGSWSDWSSWSNCSSSCNGGDTTRQRTCENVNGTGQPVYCEGEASETEACNTQSCPIHGGWGSWSDWSSCSVTCGHGIQTRDRPCDNPVPADGGDTCSGSATQSQICNGDTCPVCSVLERPTGGLWQCKESQSPYLKTCEMICPLNRAPVSVNTVYTCGENTSYLWNHERDRQTRDLALLPSCSRVRTLSTASYTQSTTMNVGCDSSVVPLVKNGIEQNLDNQILCVRSKVCQVKLSTDCQTSRKRSTSGLQVLLNVTLNLNITDSDLENNVTTWTTYRALMDIINQSFPDDAGLESLFTVNLPGGQTITPDMDSVDIDLSILCPAGTVYYDLSCVECPAGSMEENGQCVLCPLGYYQDQTAATSCKPCPAGFSWDVPGAASLEQCHFRMDVLETTTPLTTSKPDDKETLNLKLVIGLVCATLVLLVAILLTAIVAYVKHQNKKRRNSLYGSLMSLTRIFPSRPSIAAGTARNTALTPPAVSDYSADYYEMAPVPPALAGFEQVAAFEKVPVKPSIDGYPVCFEEASVSPAVPEFPAAFELDHAPPSYAQTIAAAIPPLRHAWRTPSTPRKKSVAASDQPGAKDVDGAESLT